MATDVTHALLVRLEAKPGKESDIEAFLKQGASLVDEEPKTVRWFALRIGPSTFGIFDAFPDDDGRQAHLNGKVADALKAQAEELFADVSIEPVDVIAEAPPR